MCGVCVPIKKGAFCGLCVLWRTHTLLFLQYDARFMWATEFDKFDTYKGGAYAEKAEAHVPTRSHGSHPGPTEGKLRCNPVDMLIRGQHCRFFLLHWHFCPKMAFYSPSYHQFGRQNYRFLEFTEIHPDTNKLQRFVE